ncbi:aminotransferase class I/II-fold pyridoxal phosphate-dependent enzyme [Clostridium lundense]|uniref:aminotransferase class I/II-fold pyridoxal phosphate-dependent enzyme n=1 Tax=Clostridium lundense TaxID=319475 RepID=UPI000487E4CD|nr:aminotransferase class V-fold PLP-dependent enzyme [Clostridium lundense]
MSKLPLVEGVLKYVREDNISFSMPGHKNGRGFFTTLKGKELMDNFINCDITEVDGVDNLHKAEGIIKESSELLSKFYGSEKSYFLVNGSTSGNLIMIFSSFNEGEKIIVDRNCHKSVFNGIIMRKLKPVYIKNIIDTEYNAPFSIDMEHFFKVIQENKDAKGIILTYPNYYGVCFDIEKVIKEAQKNNMKVLIDSAHGAHFGANDNLPKSAVKAKADMVVVSAHKTLASVTQTAFLHVNNKEDIDKVNFYFSVFSSTSPSYLFMCTMDYARYYLESYGEKDYDNLIYLADKYRKRIEKIDHINIISREYVRKNYDYDLDPTRYILNLDKGYNGNLLLDYLREKSIQCEMSDTFNLVLIFSLFNTEEEFQYLYNTLKECDIFKFKANSIELVNNYHIPKEQILPYEAMEKRKRRVRISEAVGCICGENVIPYPPGIPIIMMGEMIDKDIINMLEYYIENHINILGIDENKITILE